MAASEPTSAHRLRDFLQEKQEPFILEIYISEKGYTERISNSQCSFSCCYWSSRTSIKRSVRLRLAKTKKGSPWCLKVLRALYSHLNFIKERKSTKGCNYGDCSFIIQGKSKNNVQEIEESNSCSNLSSLGECSVEVNTTSSRDLISFTASGSQPFGLSYQKGKKEVTSNRKFHFQCIEDFRQLSPISVLEETDSCGSSPLDKKNLSKTEEPKKAADNFTFRASLSRLLYHSRDTLPIQQQVFHSMPFSQHRTPEMKLQQTKKLLTDCVKEDVETHRRNQKWQQCHKEYQETEELGKLVRKKIKSWGRQSADESNFTKLPCPNFAYSAQEGSRYEQQKREIGSEIGDAILEEINTEIVRDMTN